MRDRWLIIILFLQVVVSYVLFLVTKSSLFLIGVIASAGLVFFSVLATGSKKKTKKPGMRGYPVQPGVRPRVVTGGIPRQAVHRGSKRPSVAPHRR